jgi:hypothetical protein
MLSSLLLKFFLDAQRIYNLSSRGRKWNRRRRSLVKLRSFSSSLQYEENAFLLTIEKVFGCSKNLQFEQPWRKMEQKKKKKKKNSGDSSKVVSYMPLQNALSVCIKRKNPLHIY